MSRRYAPPHLSLSLPRVHLLSDVVEGKGEVVVASDESLARLTAHRRDVAERTPTHHPYKGHHYNSYQSSVPDQASAPPPSVSVGEKEGGNRLTTDLWGSPRRRVVGVADWSRDSRVGRRGNDPSLPGLRTGPGS